ncbi:hypothetical protein [Chitinophaga solisilvae]|uniref:hypothetical protein n=1 Tax=Chitinophaga solisilvae TaxID=1233460 RepID=UPI00136CE9F0|nr:hypothetical protein [Chitinophaga solisilvae]
MNQPVLLSCNSILTDQYFIPPFDVRAGELVQVYLYHGYHFYPVLAYLSKILTGAIPHENIILHQPFSYVPRFTESWWRRHFRPVTVDAYMKKHASADSPAANRIYERSNIRKNTRINTLEAPDRKLVSLSATLSRSSCIVFDLAGLGPVGTPQTFSIVKEHVQQGGAAILLDGYKDFQQECTKYVELQWLAS